MLFTSKAAVENDISNRYGLDKPLVPVQGTRNPNKEHMRYNDYNDSGILVRLLGHRTPDVTDALSDVWSEMREILFDVETPKLRKY